MVYYKFDKFPDDNTILNHWNRWNDEHHYFTCSHCGKEYLYLDSPVLKNKLWKEIVEKLNLVELDNNSKKTYANIECSIPQEKEKKILHFQQIIKKIVHDSEHCMLCVDCMEKALGRKLEKKDLQMCEMSRRFLDKMITFENNK